MFEDANKVIESRRKGHTIQLSKEGYKIYDIFYFAHACFLNKL
jgi:hypothetical protein